MRKLSSVGKKDVRGLNWCSSKAKSLVESFSVIQSTVLFACAVLVYLYNYVLICMYVISVRHIVSTFVCLLRYFVYYVVLCWFTCMWLLCRILLLCYSICFIVHSMYLVLIPTLHSYFFPNTAKHTNIKTRKKNIKYTFKALPNTIVPPFYWNRLALLLFICILTHVSSLLLYCYNHFHSLTYFTYSNSSNVFKFHFMIYQFYLIHLIFYLSTFFPIPYPCFLVHLI